jgi:hypothetical protein
MTKAFNYTSGSKENGTIRLRNFVLGIGSQDYGPSSQTGYYKSVIVPEGKYVIYDIIDGNLFYNIPRDNNEVVSYLSNKRGVQMSTLAESIYWASTQNNIFITNLNYENIITSGLSLNFDPGLVVSSPLSGSNVYDLTNNQFTGTTINSPEFNVGNYGFIRFDGTNSFIKFDATSQVIPQTGLTEFTIDVWHRQESGNNPGFGTIVGLGFGCSINRSGNDTTAFLAFQNVSSGQYLSRTQPTDVWRNFTFSFNNGFGKAYLNGQPYLGDGGSVFQSNTINWNEAFGTGRFAPDPPFDRLSNSSPNTRKISIGFNESYPDGAYLKGDVGPVKYYTRALTDAEVLHNYNALSHRYLT